MDSDLNEVQEQGEDSAFRAALEEGRHDRALAMDWNVIPDGRCEPRLSVVLGQRETAARMERSLRSRRADGDGPIVVCGSSSSSAEVEGTA